MYETYPKKGKSMLGEQTSAKFAPAKAAPEYQQVGSSDRYPAKGHKGPNTRRTSSERTRSPYLNGGGSKQVSATYPAKTHSQFGSEKVKNSLVSPTSRMPKEA